jgi:flavorubredoxin
MRNFSTQIVDTLYQTTVVPSEHFSFNQFVIMDEHPILIHTGRALWFEQTKQAVERILPANTLQYLTFSHYEADESGALNLWLGEAPKATPLVGTIGRASIEDFSHSPCQVLTDGAQINLGRLSLTFMETPHCPHNWDACMFYEPTNKVLFCSDLGAQPGVPAGVVESVDIIEDIVNFQRTVGYLTEGKFLAATLDRLEALDITYLAIQHGSTLKGEVIPALFKRLRQEFCAGIA